MSNCLRRAAVTSELPPVPAPPKTDTRVSQTGIASWYGPGFHGKATASGEIYNQNDLTAAHQTLPLGTRSDGDQHGKRPHR